MKLYYKDFIFIFILYIPIPSYISDKKIEKLKEYVDEHPEMKDVKSSVYEDGLKLMVGIMCGTEHPTVTQKKSTKEYSQSSVFNKIGIILLYGRISLVLF